MASFKNRWLSYSFIYYYDILFFFVSLDNVTSMTHIHTHVWGCFLLMVTMFFKLALCACNYNVISNEALLQAPSAFGIVLKPMINDFYIQKHSTQPDVFFNTCSEHFCKTHSKASAIKLRFCIVSYHVKFVLSS